jgi:hypothetical protein
LYFTSREGTKVNTIAIKFLFSLKLIDLTVQKGYIHNNV